MIMPDSVFANMVALPSNHIAALDIGSNSFHFVYARIIDHKIQVLHREKYRVRLASGLDESGFLSAESIDRALGVLELLAPTVEKLSRNQFRAVATYTLRNAKNAAEFQLAAAKVFPFPIEIISGHEEARLIYQGVAYTSPDNGKRLVIDIGGGSTELIVGEGYKVKSLVSLNMGCVNFNKNFFNEGAISEQAFAKAIAQAKVEVSSKVSRFNSSNWQLCIGCSGTVKAISRVISINRFADGVVNLESLQQLKQKLVEFGSIDAINIEGLNENRRPVICSGLSVLIGLFQALDIEQLTFSDAALREGVMYENYQQAKHSDVQDKSVVSLQQRFSVDADQALLVEKVMLSLFEAVSDRWELASEISDVCRWAAMLHEVGFDINVSSYHRHGAYIVSNADLPGFNTDEQLVLAWLVQNHRKKPQVEAFPEVTSFKAQRVFKALALLRLAVLVCHRRLLVQPPKLALQVDKKELTLQFESNLAISHPLMIENLQKETQHLRILGLRLNVMIGEDVLFT